MDILGFVCGLKKIYSTVEMYFTNNCTILLVYSYFYSIIFMKFVIKTDKVLITTADHTTIGTKPLTFYFFTKYYPKVEGQNFCHL